ncbi:hypothetical protein D1867_05250 [Acidianus infernus]|uniref:Uncharacterized protein n=1 Tax=Acidianus infernus TaxID=12915 RepID=A0A6A9QHE6_ACIIN|nr:hypothetical protein [Acidianus infernus]MCY0873402.1 hypothetical protein [Acidianus infernus]MCY0883603.1 hypothetical protein [Acidianus infernus]MUM64660.1 hypothetical protein [Acidianus infernus]
MNDVRDELLKILKKMDPNIVDDSLDIKFLQQYKNRYDVFGQFKDDKGIYEFALSFDTKGKIYRQHINMIQTLKLREELEKKLRE